MTRLIPLLACVPLVACFTDAPDAEDGAGTQTDESSTSGDGSASSGSMTTTSASTSTSMSTSVGTSMGSATTDDTGTGDATSTTDPTMTTDPDSSSTGEPVDVVRLDVDVEACSAAWFNGFGDTVECPLFDPKDPAFAAGHVYRATDQAVFVQTLGDVVLDDDALVMHPNFEENGQIFGQFPPLDYVDGDRFRATVTCAQNVNCDVAITLAAQLDGVGDPVVFHQLTVAYDDEGGIDVDVELPSGGSTAGLVFLVEDGSQAGSDTIVWVGPVIVRPA